MHLLRPLLCKSPLSWIVLAATLAVVAPRVTHAEADRRYDDKDENDNHTFLFIVDRRTVIDAGVDGNDARFINHSCDPNCEVDEIKDRVWIFAIRDIAAGEELLWDYNLYDDDDPAPCYCGSPKCRGTMYSKDWMAKLRRKAARKKQKLDGKRGANNGSRSRGVKENL